MKRFLSSIVPTTGPMGRWLRRQLGIDRRYGVRFSTGNLERTGFYTQREAEAFLAERTQSGVVFFYDPIDLRMVSGESVPPRAHYVGTEGA